MSNTREIEEWTDIDTYRVVKEDGQYKLVKWKSVLHSWVDCTNTEALHVLLHRVMTCGRAISKAKALLEEVTGE